MEIERKFLLKDAFILRTLCNEKVTIYKSNITQFYTEITKNSEIRYRKKDDIYYLTTKIGSGIERDEFEVVVSKNEYNGSKPKRVSSFIEKDRYSFELDGVTHAIDIYSGELAGLFILEIEFETKEEALNFTLNPLFENAKEVTEDERYKNKNLSLFGSPSLEFDTKEIFKSVEKSPNLELNFPSYIDAYDGFRVLFYQIYLSILHHKKQYLETNDPHNLHQFRVGLRKTRSLLQISKNLYNKEILKTILKGLKTTAKQTNAQRDFDVFIEYLESVEGSEEVVKSLNFVSQNQISDIDSFLNSKETKDFFMDYEAFLNDINGFYKENSYEMKKFVALCIRSEIIAIEKALFKLNSESHNDEFHEVRIDLKRLRYLLESFSHMFDISSMESLVKRLKFMQELFGNLQDRDVWCDIIDMYDKGSEKEFLLNQKEIISIEMFEIRGEILDKKAKFIKQIRKISKILKAYY